MKNQRKSLLAGSSSLAPVFSPAVTALMLTAVALPLQSFAQDSVKNNPSAVASDSGSSDTKTMPTVVVKEKAVKENIGYQNSVTTVGKTAQDVKDIPQSVTVVTRQLIEDRNADTLKEALRNVAGLTFNAGEGGRIGDNINIRGFGASSDFYLDGYRDNAQYNREIFNLERVEVLRGPASMLFGRGSTGGVVNQVSKEPGLGVVSSVAETLGTHDYARETADINQEIGDSAAIRLNVMKTDAENRDGYSDTDRFGFAPSIKWGIDTNNEFLLSYYHLEYDDTPTFGIPIQGIQGGRPIAVSPDSFYGLKNADYQKDKANVYTGRWTHHFDDNNDLKITLRQDDVERDLRSTAPRFTAPNTVTRGRQARGAVEQTRTMAADYISKFEFMKMNHESLTGIEYVSEMANRYSYPGTPANPSTTADNPDPYPILPAGYETTYARINPLDFETDNYAIYAQDVIEFIPHWKLLLGIREDDFSADYKSTATATGAVTRYNRHDAVTSYRTGLMFQPDDVSTYYVSYGTSFNPSGDVYSVEGAAGAAQAPNSDPEENINKEIGAKWELFNKKLSLRTAIFRSEKTNERNTDPSLPNIYLLSGRRHTDGVEFESSGRATHRWQIFGALALMDSEIDEQINPFGVGLTPANSPHFTGSLWNTYQFLPEWKIGGGANFVGERKGFSIPPGTIVGGVTTFTAPTIRKIPGYVSFDGLLEWDKKQYALKLNLFNILNKDFYDSIYPNGAHAIPGTDRTVQLTLSYKF